MILYICAQLFICLLYTSFYDDVEEVPQAEREMIAHIPFDEKKYKEAIGVKERFGEKGYSTLERNSCRPSFDVCGIWKGTCQLGNECFNPIVASGMLYRRNICRKTNGYDDETNSDSFVGITVALLHTSSTSGTR